MNKESINGPNAKKEEKTLRGRNLWLAGMMGLIVGDALGDPVQFMSREEVRSRKQGPVAGMEPTELYGMPEGAWTDDGSLALATADSILTLGRVDMEDIMERFVSWLEEGAYTPFGVAFDAGTAGEQPSGRPQGGAGRSAAGSVRGPPQRRGSFFAEELYYKTRRESIPSFVHIRRILRFCLFCFVSFGGTEARGGPGKKSGKVCAWGLTRAGLLFILCISYIYRMDGPS